MAFAEKFLTQCRLRGSLQRVSKGFQSLAALDTTSKELSQPPGSHELAADSFSTSSARQFSDSGPRTPRGVLYNSHTPTAMWQKAAIAVGSALGALTNPARADLVAALGETTGGLAYQRMLRRMRVDQEGRMLLAERPRVTSAAVGHAWDLPPNTFGAAYAQFMGSRNFSADERPPVRFVDDPELAYVAARAREVHDFWHVLFGCPTTVSGELALKMVELTQTGLPMCALSVIGGPLRLPSQKRRALHDVFYPWAVKAGLQAADLMCIYYEKHFEEDLEVVRKTWRIIPAPVMPKK